MRNIATLLLAILSTSAFAAENSQSVEKTWGDWSKICAPSETEERVCQIVQSANQNESGQLVFQTAVGYVTDNELPIMYLTAPLGIFLPRGISVVIGENDPVTATVQRCDGNGCIGLLALEQDFVDAMKKGTEAQLVFGASAQQNVTVPLSLKGFTAAFNALEAR